MTAYQFVEIVDEVLVPQEKLAALSSPTVLVITKTGKFIRGHVIDHNVRIFDGRLKGRIVMQVDGQNRDIDSHDISSLEKIK